MDTQLAPLSTSELAELAGATEAEVDRMVGLGILVPRDRSRPLLATDVQKVRLAKACEQASLPMEGIASAIRAGGCRSRSWRPPRSGAGRCARREPTGR